MLGDLLFVTLGVGECGPSGRNPLAPPTAAQCLTVPGACPGEGAVRAASVKTARVSSVLSASPQERAGREQLDPRLAWGRDACGVDPPHCLTVQGVDEAGKTLGQRHCGQSAGDTPALQLVASHLTSLCLSFSV